MKNNISPIILRYDYLYRSKWCPKSEKVARILIRENDQFVISKLNQMKNIILIRSFAHVIIAKQSLHNEDHVYTTVIYFTNVHHKIFRIMYVLWHINSAIYIWRQGNPCVSVKLLVMWPVIRDLMGSLLCRDEGVIMIVAGYHQTNFLEHYIRKEFF